MGANAYFMFGSYIRSQPGGPKGLKEVQQAWVQLGAEGQKKYIDQADEAKKKFEEDMAAFRKTAEGKKYLRLKMGAEKRMTLQKAKKKFLGGKDAMEEPKRPPSPYFLFLQERGSQFEGADKSQRAQKLTEAWNNLGEEKKAFEQKAKELKDKYDEDLKAYKNSKGYKAYESTLNRLSGKTAQKKQALERAKAVKLDAAKKRAAKFEAIQKAKAARTGAAKKEAKPKGGGRGRGRAAPKTAAKSAAKDKDSSSDAMGS